MSPLKKDGASTSSRDPSCSISQVFLLHEPFRGSRASSVVGLAETVTISAVPETNGDRSL